MGSLGYLCYYQSSEYLSILDKVLKYSTLEDEQSSKTDDYLDTPIIMNRDRIVLNMDEGIEKVINSSIYPEHHKVAKIKKIHALNEIVIE